MGKQEDQIAMNSLQERARRSVRFLVATFATLMVGMVGLCFIVEENAIILGVWCLSMIGCGVSSIASGMSVLLTSRKSHDNLSSLGLVTVFLTVVVSLLISGLAGFSLLHLVFDIS